MSNESVIQRQVETYNAHDLDGFVGCFAPDAVLQDLASGSLIARGRADIRETYRSTFSRTPRAGVSIIERMTIKSIVIDFEHLHTDGSDAVAIYRVAEGHITHLWLVPPALVELPGG